MKFLENLKKGKLVTQQPQREIVLPSPEIAFYVPEGAIPDGELTPEQQAEVQEHQANLQRVIRLTSKPYTEMLHLAAFERDKRCLSTVLKEEKGYQAIPFDYNFFGIIIGHGVHQREVIERTQKQTDWEVAKASYTKGNSLVYWQSIDDSIKVDRFGAVFQEPDGSELGSLDLQYDVDQQLKKALLRWVGPFPQILDQFTNHNNGISTILRELAQPKSAVIRALERGVYAIGYGSYTRENLHHFGGQITYNLDEDPSIDLEIKTTPQGKIFTSTFEYKPLQDQRFIRSLRGEQLGLCELGDLSTRPDIPAKLAILGLESMLSMMKPEKFTQG